MGESGGVNKSISDAAALEIYVKSSEYRLRGRLPVQVDTVRSGSDLIFIQTVLEIDWMATIP